MKLFEGESEALYPDKCYMFMEFPSIYLFDPEREVKAVFSGKDNLMLTFFYASSDQIYATKKEAIKNAEDKNPDFAQSHPENFCYLILEFNGELNDTKQLFKDALSGKKLFTELLRQIESIEHPKAARLAKDEEMIKITREEALASESTPTLGKP